MYSVYYMENELCISLSVYSKHARGGITIITFTVIRHGSYFSEPKHASGLMDSWELGLRRLTV
jgi:hypothetical protein